MGFVSPRHGESTFGTIQGGATDKVESDAQERPSAGPQTGAGLEPDVQDRVKGAHRLFFSRTHKKLLRAAEIAAAMDDPAAPENRASLSELQNIAHSIAGNAGSFGYQKLSEIAEKLDAALDLERFDQDLIFDHVIAMAAEFLGAKVP